MTWNSNTRQAVLTLTNQALLLPRSKLFAQLRAISAQYATNLMWSIIALSFSIVEVVIGGGDRNRTDE